MISYDKENSFAFNIDEDTYDFFPEENTAFTEIYKNDVFYKRVSDESIIKRIDKQYITEDEIFEKLMDDVTREHTFIENMKDIING